MKVSRNKLDVVSPLDADDVVSETTFFQYAHQMLGTPLPRSKDIIKVRKQLKLFFEAYPAANYDTLTDVVTWAKAKRRHYDMGRLVSCYRWAYEDGFMHRLTRPAPDADGMLNMLLDVVDDPIVRTNMRQAPDTASRDEIYALFMNDRVVSKDLPTDSFLDSLNLFAGEVVRFKSTLADDWAYGTVLGAKDDKVFVHNQETYHLQPWMIQARIDGSWKILNPRSPHD